ncbi:MAG TPA: UDP-N-acetylmuramate:L-alanyl-gamma-D-glutamyl-meso-diaminopimelate ligase [Gammaproteobacteria bacterium]|nr:UDP-N-acetylmuramate:L-alanyl-gamma-D-glutamyl-meso-diaminopimelate ligase [Gammaproteobacteria bacterium]HAT26585.1 UDP-N-acetylmuramate:L-alanyl-gamma-D-glutamyl-meso-diaminopimelate ligase [Gammaproteobacteria bacterium]
MHVHILGICGSFMGSMAILAKQLGYRVSGSDANVYPPMSTQLVEQGIELLEGYRSEHLHPHPDLVIIGNALSRGNPAVEYVLSEGLNYTSGPQWLAQYVLHDKWVLGVAGTHGKTTTSAMLAWILESAGLHPGYLIGGVSKDLPSSASLGASAFFVVEADEYDSAFFDKRSKFIHYAPRTAVLNNLEFDHADIFDNLAAIEKQFHHLVRTIPGNGLIIYPHEGASIETVLRMGCWTRRQQFGIDVPEEICKKLAAKGGVFWNATLHDQAGSEFELVKYGQGSSGEVMNRAVVDWEMTGLHNVRNGMAAVAAAHHVGVDVSSAQEALNQFKGVKRRLELRGEVGGIEVYDDFAHHPTAIAATLAGLVAKLAVVTEQSRLIAVIEPKSNTMKFGVHQDQLAASCQAADMVVWQQPEQSKLDFEALVAASKVPAYVFREVDEIVSFLEENCRAGDRIVVMSNGGFGRIHEKLLEAFDPGPAGSHRL